MSTEMVRSVSDLTTAKLLELSWYSGKGYDELATRLEAMSDEELAATIERATSIADRAWWLRGLAVREVRRRVEERNASIVGRAGRELVEEALARIGRKVHVEVRTLQKDAEIVDALLPILAERDDMTGSDDLRSSNLVTSPPEGLSRAVCQEIIRQRDKEGALETALEMVGPDATVSVQLFLNTYSAKQRGEILPASDALLPAERPVKNGERPMPGQAEIGNSEWINVPVEKGTRALVQKILEKENLATSGQAVQRAIEVAWYEVIAKRRSDARNAVK